MVIVIYFSYFFGSKGALGHHGNLFLFCWESYGIFINASKSSEEGNCNVFNVQRNVPLHL
jgi:hypothetical protein